MKIVRVIWLRDIIDKLEWKHHVRPDEVEEVFAHRPRFRKIAKGHIQGEDVYGAFGQTEAGRYLSVFFIQKAGQAALIISARDMDAEERGRYERK